MGIDFSVLNPLAYGFAEDGKMYVKLRWQLVEGVEHASNIGKELVDFAFCGDDPLCDVLEDISDRFARLMAKRSDARAAVGKLLKECRPQFAGNLYFSIYLMSFFDFLAFGLIDCRTYTGASTAERVLRGWDGSEGAENSSDVASLIDQADHV